MRLFRSISLAAVLFVAGCGPAQLAEYTSSNTSVDSTLDGNSLEHIIQPYRQGLQAEMLQVIGHSDSSLISYAPESPLSNFVADVIFDRGITYASANGLPCKAYNTFCMLNFGGIRSVINKGDITVSTLYELMPFDNTLVIVELAPKQVGALLEMLYTMKGQPVSNADFRVGEKTREIIFEEDLVHPSDQNLFVITSDYLANGGDKMAFFKEAVNRWDTGLLFRDVLIQYIKAQKDIEYTPVNGRMQILP